MRGYIGSQRTRNTRRNVFFGMVKTAVSLLLPFVTRTVLIYRFGTEYVGLNGLFSSVLQVLNLAEMGFGTAIVFSLYRPMAENDTDTVCAYLGYYRRVYRVIGGAILILGLALIPALPYLIKDGAIPDGLSLVLCYLIFLGDSVLSYLLFSYLTVIPTALQRGDILSRMDTGVVVLKNLVQILLLLYAGSFYWYLISAPALTVVRNILVARTVRRRFPAYRSRGELSKGQRHFLRKKIYGLFINKLFAISRNGIDSLCISAFLGLTLAGIYSNYYMLLAGLVGISGIVSSAMIPSVGNSIVMETPEKNYADMRKFDFLYTGLAGWAAVALLCLYQPFMRLWMGEGRMLGWPEVFALSMYFYLLKCGDLRWIYHEGAGLWWESRWIAIAEAVANVVLNVLLCRRLGVFGIILATLLTLFFLNYLPCPVILFRYYFKNDKLGEYFWDHLMYFLTLLPGGTLCFLLCLLLGEGGAAFALRVILCLVVPGPIFWLFWRRAEQYAQAVAWLKQAKLLRIPWNRSGTD